MYLIQRTPTPLLHPPQAPTGDSPWSRGHQHVAHRVPVAASMGFPPPLFSDPSWAQAAKMEAARVCSVCIRSSSWMEREWRLVRAASSSPSSSDVLACASWVGDDWDFFILDSRWWRLRGGGLWGCPPPRFSLSELERREIRWWPTKKKKKKIYYLETDQENKKWIYYTSDIET